MLDSLDVITLNPKPLDWGKLVGGLIFGLGMGLLGYCPGTMLSRIGEGKKDSWMGLAGMVLGIHSWVIVPVAAILFISIIYVANRKADDFKKIF